MFNKHRSKICYTFDFIPYQKGFTIKIDNKEIEYKKVDNKYIGFPITSGTHTITVKYNVPGKQVGIILSIIGFRPQIEECGICKAKEKLEYFSIRESGFKCKACAKQDGGAIEISQTSKDAIRYIILADAKRIYSFTVPESTQKELEIISKLYLTECLEKEYKL